MQRPKVKGSIFSSFGFYIGDPCYVLPDGLYYKYWGDKHHFADGEYRAEMGGIPAEGGVSVGFVVSGTAYGDGTYKDQYGHSFPVDSGSLAVVSLELVKDVKEAVESGFVFYTTTDAEYPEEDADAVFTPGEAHFEEEGGIFNVTMPNGYKVTIDTKFFPLYLDEDDDDC